MSKKSYDLLSVPWQSISNYKVLAVSLNDSLWNLVKSICPGCRHFCLTKTHDQMTPPAKMEKPLSSPDSTSSKQSKRREISSISIQNFSMRDFRSENLSANRQPNWKKDKTKRKSRSSLNNSNSHTNVHRPSTSRSMVVTSYSNIPNFMSSWKWVESNVIHNQHTEFLSQDQQSQDDRAIPWCCLWLAQRKT